MQFFPFPVYPGWQSHTCDPMVLRQFAFSWQEWFPLHSSTSMKSEIKKMRFQIIQKMPFIRHYRVKECEFSTFCWIARTRDCRTWRKKVIYLKSYHVITFSRVTTSPIFEELKHVLSRYQNKHQQTTRLTKSHCTIQRESEGFWNY